MVAFPTAVNSQIIDAVTETSEPPADGPAESPVADAEPPASEPGAPAAGDTEPGDTVVQAVLLSIGTEPAKAIGLALAAMAQAAGMQMANAVSSYQSWTTVQRAILSQSAAEILAAELDAPALTRQPQGA